MTSATAQGGTLAFSNGKTWVPFIGAVLGALTAFSAHSGRDAVIVVATAVAAAGLTAWAAYLGALMTRPRGQRPNWKAYPAALVGDYLVMAALSGWSLDVWSGALVAAAQTWNGITIGFAVYGLARHLRRRHSAPPALS